MGFVMETSCVSCEDGTQFFIIDEFNLSRLDAYSVNVREVLIFILSVLS
jgi:hypothetical protein